MANQKLISVPSLGVYYCQQILTLSVWPDVCPSVTLLQIASSFLFLDGIEPFFWPSFLHVPLYKTLYFDFWFRPPQHPKFTPQNLHKIAYMSACMADRPRDVWAYQGVFGDGRFNRTLQNVVGPTLVAGNKIWARCGDPVPYRLVSLLLCALCKCY